MDLNPPVQMCRIRNQAKKSHSFFSQSIFPVNSISHYIHHFFTPPSLPHFHPSSLPHFHPSSLPPFLNSFTPSFSSLLTPSFSSLFTPSTPSLPHFSIHWEWVIWLENNFKTILIFNIAPYIVIALNLSQLHVYCVLYLSL